MRIKAVRLPPPQWWYRVKPDPSFDPLRRLTVDSALRVLRLWRVVRRLEALGGRCRTRPHLRREKLAGMLARTIERQDDGRDGGDVVSLACREACGAPERAELPPVPELPELPDQRPGCYYVSARDPDTGDHWLVAGSYPWHSTALSLVADVRAHAEKIDSRAFWKAWGTSRTEDTRQTSLGPWRPPQAQPEVSQPTPKRRRAKAPVAVDSYRHPEVRR